MVPESDKVQKTPAGDQKPRATISVQEILARAQVGDKSIVPLLHQLFEIDPRIWQEAGDLAAHAERAIVGLAAGDNLLVSEALTLKAAAMRAELAGPSAGKLERLLIERIVACWLQVHYADVLAAQLKRPTPQDLAAAGKRQQSAERRYLAAVRALAMVRKLVRPPLSPVDLATRPVEETHAPRSTPHRHPQTIRREYVQAN